MIGQIPGSGEVCQQLLAMMSLWSLHGQGQTTSKELFAEEKQQEGPIFLHLSLVGFLEASVYSLWERRRLD